MQIKLVGVLGFEPRTSSLSGTRSNQLSYTPDIPLKMALPSATGLGSPFGNRHFPGAPLYVSPCAFGVLLTSSMVPLLFSISLRSRAGSTRWQLVGCRPLASRASRAAPTSAARKTEADARPPLSVSPCAFGVLMTASKVLLRFNNTLPAPSPI